MQIDNQKILVAIVVTTLVLFLVVGFTSGLLRIVLGLPSILFFPGYTLLSAVFPKRNDLSGVERVALSLGLSVAIVPVIGLFINYTLWGITLYPITASIAIFIFITSGVAWFRQRKLPESERLSVILKASLPRWAGMTKINRALSVSLILAILIAMGCLTYVIATPRQGQKFTEFYVLGMGGRAQDYPKQMMQGESASVIVGITNHEYEPSSYRVEITIEGTANSEVDLGKLGHEEKLEQKISFTPWAAGERQKIEFWLYKDNENEPYYEEPLHLWIDVIAL